MISFGKFCDILDGEFQLKECARLMSTSERDPKEIIESVLDLDILESWKSWFGDLGRTAKAAGQIAGGVGAGVAAAGQKVMQGVRQAADTTGGPLVKFQKAIEILKDLEQVLRNNPATKGIASQSAPKRSIAGYIQAIYKALEKERSSMPQMVGKNRLGSESPNKYLRGSQIEKRQAAMRGNNQPQNQPQAQTQVQQTQNSNQQQNQEYPPMKLAQ